jgi:hypothetical protein
VGISRLTDEILHVHHWHRQKIHCQDTKTIKEEDLPFIECCCRCNQEREIPPTKIPPTDIITNFQRNMPDAKSTEWSNALTTRQRSTVDRLRKQEQKREFAGADATLRAYHARKAKKKTSGYAAID